MMWYCLVHLSVGWLETFWETPRSYSRAFGFLFVFQSEDALHHVSTVFVFFFNNEDTLWISLDNQSIANGGRTAMLSHQVFIIRPDIWSQGIKVAFDQFGYISGLQKHRCYHSTVLREPKTYFLRSESF